MREAFASEAEETAAASQPIRSPPAPVELRTRIAELNEKLSTLRIKLQAKNEQIKKHNKSIKRLRSLWPLQSYVGFANLCVSHADRLMADVIVCHGVETLLAGQQLRATAGGKLICDVIEIPSFALRAQARPWGPPVLSVIDASAEQYLRTCEALMTVSSPLAAALAQYSRPVHVFPNYRRAAPIARSDALRERLGLAPQDTIVVAACTITQGLENVIRALPELDTRFHLVTIGRISPAQYQQDISSLMDALGLNARVHMLEKVPFEELGPLLSGADLGLVVLNEAIVNHQVSLPNRVFDYVSAGVPFCSPPIPAIKAVIEEFGLGLVTEESPQAWAASIAFMAGDLARFRAKVEAARQALSWEAIEDQFLRALSDANSITFLGLEDLRRNQRTLRMAQTLAAAGVRVTLCCSCAAGPAESPAQAPYTELIFPWIPAI